MIPARPYPYLDSSRIDWSTVARATYEVHQTLWYEYPGPIADLRQVLIVLPPDRIGGQRLLDHALTVDPNARPRYDSDRFGNRLCHVALPRVEGRLGFDISMRIEQETGSEIQASHTDAPAMYLLPSPLAEPFDALHPVAVALRRAAPDSNALAEAINQWVANWLTYTQGATDVRTTAADAFDLRRGVCQDYAHLMIALCRLCRLPARYVSGHLLGEGAMHAWVQVRLPAASEGDWAWRAFDPTHGRRAGMSYLTIAVGRDYGDVSPTRGTFRAAFAGRLAGGSKEAGVVEVLPA